MVLCKYFANGEDCPFSHKCPDEHLDVRQFVRSELEFAINGDQWPLSAFGPFTEKPSIPDYIEDASFEEVRWMYYGSDSKKFFECCQKFSNAITDAKNKMQLLLTMNKEVMDTVIDLYDYCEPPITEHKANPFDLGTNFFGRSLFGGSTLGVPISSDLFSGVQKPAFGQTPFVGFGVPQQPRGFGLFDSSTSTQQPQQSIGKVSFPQAEQKMQQLKPFNGNPLSQAASKAPDCAKGCGECKDFLKEIVAKMDNILSVVQENKSELKVQEEEIKSLISTVKKINISEKSNEEKVSESVEKKRPVIKNVPPLVIIPKAKQNSGKTRNEIKSRINPWEMSIQIDSVSKDKSGGIIIKCKNEESVKKIKHELTTKCGEQYELKRLRLANPQILVNGIDNEVDENHLIDIIKKQNDLNGEIKLIKCFEASTNSYKYNAVFEVNKDLYKGLMEESDPYFNIGWNKCNVYDNLHVKRCYNCWGFNHYSRNCRNEPCCPKCAGQHLNKDCKSSKFRCPNCCRANVRLNMNLDVKHDARNYNCYVYLKWLEKERKAVDY